VTYDCGKLYSKKLGLDKDMHGAMCKRKKEAQGKIGTLFNVDLEALHFTFQIVHRCIVASSHNQPTVVVYY
jgi:hypothetical protein